nr:hypothetical protein [Tanacetum cinerariifolium]
KLDDRSKLLVYLDKEPSSGGFRLYSPCENKIIISAYVICDEKRGWKRKAESSTQTGKEEDTFTVLWNDTKGAEFQQPLNVKITNGPAVQEQPTHDSLRNTSTVHATVPGQNTHQVAVNNSFHSPQTPTKRMIIKTMNFLSRTTLDCINEFKRRRASLFEMSDLGEITYYLGIKVSQEKDCVNIKQERYAMKILKEAGMEDCNATLCPMEPGLKVPKAEDEQEVEATQYRKVQANWLRELLAEVTGLERQKVTVEHVSGDNQRADPLTKALARIKFKEMRSLLATSLATSVSNLAAFRDNSSSLCANFSKAKANNYRASDPALRFNGSAAFFSSTSVAFFSRSSATRSAFSSADSNFSTLTFLFQKYFTEYEDNCYRSDTINNSRGGRVGGALQDMGTGQDLLVKIGTPVPLVFPGSILVCSRNDDLDVVLNSTPQSRWSV